MRHIPYIIYSILFLFTCSFADAKTTVIAADSLRDAGNECLMSSRYIEALDYYTRGMKQAEEEQNMVILLSCKGNIGNVYSAFGDYAQALPYYLECYETATENHLNSVARKAGNNIMACYCFLGKIEEAKKYLKLASQIPDSNQVLTRYYLYSGQSLIARHEGNLRVALALDMKCMDFIRSHNMDALYEISQLNSIANDHMSLKNTSEAHKYFDEAYKMADSIGVFDQMRVALIGLASVCKEEGKDDLATYYSNRATAIGDSLFNQQAFISAKNRLVEYESNQLKHELTSLNDKITWQTFIIIAFSALLIMILILTFIIYRQKRDLSEAYTLLVQKNKEHIRDLKHQTGPKAEETKQDTADTPRLLSDEQTSALLKAIADVMERTEVISDSDFSMSKLAELVNSNTKYVSWVVNDTYHKNFKTYLNEYRIRVASERLVNSEEYNNQTVQAIGISVGYKSYAAFVQAFKNIVGVTPGMYRKLGGC